ncbi:MAG: hypothetical protein E7188_04355 [Erysipelotrichaceae bacterium]|nr:hypothetical protein [Erysipelotrichaceae bacterium]
MSGRYEKRITCTDEARNAWLFELFDRGLVIVCERFDEMQQAEIDRLRDRFIANCDLLIEMRR